MSAAISATPIRLAIPYRHGCTHRRLTMRPYGRHQTCRAWQRFGLECREATWPPTSLPRVALSLPQRAGRASTA
jgi:hypothetical protein